MTKIKTSPFLPEKLEVEKISENNVKFSIHPFEAGYGVTVAHPLRRLLLNSSIGCAPIAIKIDGVSHEFDTIRGMLEDVTDFILNLKAISFKIKTDEECVTAHYTFEGSKDLKGADLTTEQLEVVTPDAFLATLNKDVEISFFIIVHKGLGFVSSEDLRDEIPEDYITLDAYFTPVRKAIYNIENVLVEDNPNFEKIVLEIETNGQLSPTDALNNALTTFHRQLSVFRNDIEVLKKDVVIKKDSSVDLGNLVKSIEEINLGARSVNGLKNAGISFLGEIILMGEKELNNIGGLGKKSVDDIKKALEAAGYPLSCELPSNLVEALKKKLKS